MTNIEDPKVENSDGEVAQTEKKSAGIRFFEWIGAHPLSTGILAIVGILGFAVSVFGFGLDRKESTDTTKQLQEVNKKLDQSPADKFPKFGFMQLEDDQVEFSFSDFLHENENRIVELKIAFPYYERHSDGGLFDDTLFYIHEQLAKDGTPSGICIYYYFKRNEHLMEYVVSSNRYWHVNGFFKVGSDGTGISDPELGCMVFWRRLTPIPLTNDKTTVY